MQPGIKEATHGVIVAVGTAVGTAVGAAGAIGPFFGHPVVNTIPIKQTVNAAISELVRPLSIIEGKYTPISMKRKES